MPEELSNPYGMSGATAEDPSMLAARHDALDLKDKHVYDVNGLELGKVASAFGEEGSLTRVDIHLSENARQLLVDTREVVGVPADAIARVEEDAVRLNQAGEQLLHPEDPRTLSSSLDKRGAKELPRKIR